MATLQSKKFKTDILGLRVLSEADLALFGTTGHPAAPDEGMIVVVHDDNNSDNTSTTATHAKKVKVYQDGVWCDLATIRNGILTITAPDTMAAGIVLESDEGDDAGDSWKIVGNDAGTGLLSFQNDQAVKDTYEDMVTFQAHATATSSTATFKGNVVIDSDLTVHGTTTTINSTELTVDDINITLGHTNSGSGGADTAANGGGITLKSTDGDKTILWQNDWNRWTFNQGIQIELDATESDHTNGLLFVRNDSVTITNEILGGIGFDSADGNIPSSVLEASAFIAAKAAEGHHATDKGGYLIFGCSKKDDDDDTASHTYMKINEDGGVLITPEDLKVLEVNDAGTDGYVQITGQGAIKLYRHDDSNNASYMNFYRSRGNETTQTKTLDSHIIGALNFYSYDDDYAKAASILAVADGDHGDTTTDVPGRLEFYTTPNESDAVVERMVIKSDGRVGIGTPSPATLVHVNKASGENELRLQSSNKYTSIIQKDNAELIVQNASSGPIIFYDNSAETMRIEAGGEVGIGVSDPDARLEILSTSTQLKLSNNADDYASFTVGTNGDLTLATVDAASDDAKLTLDIDGQIELNAHDGTIDFKSDTASLMQLTNTGLTFDDATTIEATTGDLNIKATGNDADIIFTVDDNGNDVTAFYLDGSIHGRAMFTPLNGGYLRVNDQGDNNSVDIKGDGNIELFTYDDTANGSKITFKKYRLTSPYFTQNNDVLGAIDFVGYDGGTPSFAAAASIKVSADADHGDDTSDVPGRIEFLTTPDGSDVLSTRMVIKSDGLVGIGVSDPDSHLEIFGTSTQLKLSNNADDYASFAVGTNGDLTITTHDQNAGAANFVVVADGAVDIDANAGTLSLDGSSGINIGTETDVAVDINASTLAIDASNNTNITVGGTDKTLDIDATGTVSIDSGTSITIGAAQDKPIDIDAATLQINSSDDTNLSMNVNAAATKTLVISATNANGSNVSNIDVDADGTLSLDAAAGINIGTAADASIDIDAAQLSIDASDDTNITVTGAGNTLDIDAAGALTIDSGASIGIGTANSGTSISIGHTTSETTVNDNLTVTGNLTVNGTTTTINSTTLSVDDKNIELGLIENITGVAASAALSASNAEVEVSDADGVKILVGATLTKTNGVGAFNAGGATVQSKSSSGGTTTLVISEGNNAAGGAIEFTVDNTTDAAVDGGGITLKGTTDKEFKWVSATNRWTTNVGMAVTGDLKVGTNGYMELSDNQIGVSSGDFTLDVAGDIRLDAAGDQIRFADAGTDRMVFNLGTASELDVSGDFKIDAVGNITIDTDGGTLSIEDDGASLMVLTTSGLEFDDATEIEVTSGDLEIKATGNDSSIAFTVDDSGVDFEAFKIDGQYNGTAFFTPQDGGYLEVNDSGTDGSTMIHGSGVLSIMRHSDTVDDPPQIHLWKTRGNEGAMSKVLDGDILGRIKFSGRDTNVATAASIEALADGEFATGGSDDTDGPGKLRFLTSPDGTDTPVERMVIKSDGKVGIGVTSPNTSLHIGGNDALVIPVGNNGNRGTATQGGIRYNTDQSTFEGYDGSAWGSLGGVIDVDQDTYITAEATTDSDQLEFYTFGQKRMSIEKLGDIRIAGAQSDKELNVFGTIQISKLGAELVPTPANFTDWRDHTGSATFTNSPNWSVNGSYELVYTFTNGGAGTSSQYAKIDIGNVIEASTLYELSYTVAAAGGTPTLKLDGSANQMFHGGSTITLASTNGTHVQQITSHANAVNTDKVQIFIETSGATSGDTLKLTNFSLKRVKEGKLIADGNVVAAGLEIGSTAINDIDEDMAGGVSSNHDSLATAKTIKDYVDSQVSGVDLTFGLAGDTGSGSVATSGNLQIAGGSGISTVVGTPGPAHQAEVSLSNVDALRVLANVGASPAPPAPVVIETNVATASGNDDTLASAKSIKAYVDSSAKIKLNHVQNSNLTNPLTVTTGSQYDDVMIVNTGDASSHSFQFNHPENYADNARVTVINASAENLTIGQVGSPSTAFNFNCPQLFGSAQASITLVAHQKALMVKSGNGANNLWDVIVMAL